MVWMKYMYRMSVLNDVALIETERERRLTEIMVMENTVTKMRTKG